MSSNYTYSVGQDEAQLELVTDGLCVTTSSQGQTSREDRCSWSSCCWCCCCSECACSGRSCCEGEDHGCVCCVVVGCRCWSSGLMVVNVRLVRTRMSVAVYDSAGGGKDWRGRATRWRGIARTSPAVTAEAPPPVSLSQPKPLPGQVALEGLRVSRAAAQPPID